jgi:hypothetical protein
MRIFDCHSHWGTKKGYLFRTEAELARQEKICKTPVRYYTEDEQADYFRRNNARVILDLSWVKFMPIEEMREYHDYIFEVQRKHRDVIFGQWLQFDPRKGVDAVREFERCVALKAGFVGVCVTVRSPACRPAIPPGIPSTKRRSMPGCR